MSISINLSAETEALLVQEAHRSGIDIGQFVAGLIRNSLAAAKPNKANLSKRESELFAIINQGFSENFWARWDELENKRQDEMLTEPEHQEFLKKTEQMENANFHRIKALAELAKLRKMDLRDLMQQLEISPRNGQN